MSAPRPGAVAASLLATVDAFWSVEASGGAARVLPDGCLDFLFELATVRQALGNARVPVEEARSVSRRRTIHFWSYRRSHAVSLEPQLPRQQDSGTQLSTL